MHQALARSQKGIGACWAWDHFTLRFRASCAGAAASLRTYMGQGAQHAHDGGVAEALVQGCRGLPSTANAQGERGGRGSAWMVMAMRSREPNNKEAAMRVMHQTCAGMDVHKKDIKVCLVTHDHQGQRQEAVRSFRTMTRDILAMRAWLQA